MKKEAEQLTIGDKVLHSGQYWVILEVREKDGVVCCITANGGRVSFFVGSVVSVK